MLLCYSEGLGWFSEMCICELKDDFVGLGYFYVD